MVCTSFWGRNVPKQIALLWTFVNKQWLFHRTTDNDHVVRNAAKDCLLFCFGKSSHFWTFNWPHLLIQMNELWLVFPYFKTICCCSSKRLRKIRNLFPSILSQQKGLFSLHIKKALISSSSITILDINYGHFLKRLLFLTRAHPYR